MTKESTMDFYFISDETEDGFNRDLMVRSTSLDHALVDWREFFGITAWDKMPAQVFLFNRFANHGPLAWHTEDCPMIYPAPNNSALVH